MFSCRIFKIIIFLCFILSLNINSQTNKTNDIKYAVCINPVTFINYNNFDNKNGVLNLGLNPEFSGNINKHYVSIGAILGNSYPILPFTNYYIGYDYKLKSYNSNIELLFNSKFSIMRYKNKFENTLLNKWEEYGIFNGLTLQKKLKKTTLGISYLHKFAYSKFTLINYKSSTISTKFNIGYNPIGYLIFKLSYNIN